MTHAQDDSANRDHVFAVNADLWLNAIQPTTVAATARLDRLQEAYQELETAVMLVTVPAGTLVEGREKVMMALDKINAIRRETL